MSKELHKVRRFPAEDRRVESGPIMFGDDWPGLFLRGDNCIGYVFALREMLYDKAEMGWITRGKLTALLNLLESTHCENNDAFPIWNEGETE